MNSLDYVVDKVLKVIRKDISRKTIGYDTVGIVKRLDGNIVWVQFDKNNSQLTPVNKSINCEKGDLVRVRVSNGSAFIVGNDSKPPTDDSKAEQALTQAQDAEVKIEEVSTSIVTDDKIMYLVTNVDTGVTRDTAGWQETPATMTEANPYLWTYHIYSVGQGDATYSEPVLTGVYGERGADINNIEEYYAVNNDADNPPADSAFTTNYEQPTASAQYLWNREKIIFSDNTYHFTPKHVLTTYNPGASGRGIASITNYYARTTTTTQPSSWSTTPPTITATYKYLWNYEYIAYTDGLNPTSTTPAIIGVYGDKGSKGDKGDTGDTGQTGATGPQGVSVTKVTPYYYLSTSSSSLSGGSWSATPQTFVHGKYYWTREYIEFTDTSYNTYSTAVYNAALTNANETAYEAKTQAEGVNQYFWNKETGGTTDIPTGSYVTEVPQDEFTNTSHANYCSGGNLVLQSNRLRLRLAAITLAELTTTGMNIYLPSDTTNPVAHFGEESILGSQASANVRISTSGMKFYNGSTEKFGINYNLNSGSGGQMEWRLSSAIRSFVETGGGSTYSFAGMGARHDALEYASISFYSESGTDRSQVGIRAEDGTNWNYITVKPTRTIMTSPLRIEGHDSDIGTTVNANGSRSLSHDTWQSITGCYVDLTAGTWLIIGTVALPSKSSGRIGARIYNSTDADDYSTGRTVCGYSGANAVSAVFTAVITSQKRFYVQGYQSSGSSVTTNTCNIRATRIA